MPRERELDEACDRLMAAFDPERFVSLGHASVDHLGDALRATAARNGAVWPTTPPDTVYERWPEPGRAPRMGFEPFVRQVLEGSTRQHHPGFVGQQLSAPLPLAGPTAMLSALLNNSSAIFEGAPVQIALERRVVEWMLRRVGYGPSAGGVLTSGGTLGGLTALLAMRQAMVPGDAWETGLAGGARHAVLVSSEAHYCNARACAVLGLGQRAVFAVPADEAFRMDINALDRVYREARDQGYRPVALVANAGSTATGSHDDLRAAARFSREHGLWLHVDAAHGGGALMSARYRPLLDGIESADSIVWDAHKLMLAPSLSTAVLVQDGRHLDQAFRQEAAYLLDSREEGPWFQPARRNFETTKPGSVVLPLYAGLITLGTDYFAAYVDYIYDLARAFADEVRARAAFELCVAPESNIVCFRHTAAPDRRDALQIALREAVNRSGRFFIMRTTLRDAVWLRVVLMNPATRLRDLRELLDELETYGRAP